MELRAVLISGYELGHQSFGIASAAAWMRRAGAQVRCIDLAVERLDEEAIRSAHLVAFHLPMHTATRIAARAVGKIRGLNPWAHLCFFGLYAPLNERRLRQLGAGTVLGGEFESGLESLVRRLASGDTVEQSEPVVSTARQQFLVPRRDGMPPLEKYAAVVMPDGTRRTVGYTESSRGCRHLCRHCPVVPVYRGRFRVVQRDVVLADISQQIAAGAQHITFGDPDFFNGIGHALGLVEALHLAHPECTYDVTIKIEHLLRHAGALGTLRKTGCLFITSAVESVDDRVLQFLDKGHTRQDVHRAVELCRREGLALSPTFVPFTPWLTLPDYRDLLEFIERMELVDLVAPVQLSIRLLIPAGSRLIELPQVRGMVGPFDAERLVHPWSHPDHGLDRLQEGVTSLVHAADAAGLGRGETFDRIRALAGAPATLEPRPARAAIPWLTEPWYC